MALLMADKRKLHRETRFPVMYVFNIFVEGEINMGRKFDLSVSSFLEWVKKSHPPGPPATILK
jgi:hypothetical protein